MRSARSYEIVFVNDGSRDRSAALLREQFELRPDVTRVVLFSSNFGQHRAILAGFAHSRGRYVITLDADLQNPPEEIGRLLAELDAGHDYVGTIRIAAPGRRLAPLRLAPGQRDPRAHHARAASPTRAACSAATLARWSMRSIQCSEYNTFMPALAYTFAMHPTEIQRGARGSRRRRIEVFAVQPDAAELRPDDRFFDRAGAAVLGHRYRDRAAVGAVRAVLVVRRFVVGPEAEGVFTLFAIAFFLHRRGAVRRRTARRIRRAASTTRCGVGRATSSARCWSSARIRSGDARSHRGEQR